MVVGAGGIGARERRSSQGRASSWSGGAGLQVTPRALQVTQPTPWQRGGRTSTATPVRPGGKAPPLRVPPHLWQGVAQQQGGHGGAAARSQRRLLVFQAPPRAVGPHTAQASAAAAALGGAAAHGRRRLGCRQGCRVCLQARTPLPRLPLPPALPKRLLQRAVLLPLGLRVWQRWTWQRVRGGDVTCAASRRRGKRGRQQVSTPSSAGRRAGLLPRRPALLPSPCCCLRHHPPRPPRRLN